MADASMMTTRGEEQPTEAIPTASATTKAEMRTLTATPVRRRSP